MNEGKIHVIKWTTSTQSDIYFYYLTCNIYGHGCPWNLTPMLEPQVNSGVLDSVCLWQACLCSQKKRRERENGRILLVIFPKPYKKSLWKPETVKIRGKWWEFIPLQIKPENTLFSYVRWSLSTRGCLQWQNAVMLNYWQVLYPRKRRLMREENACVDTQRCLSNQQGIERNKIYMNV